MIINNLQDLYDCLNSEAMQSGSNIQDLPESKKTELLVEFYRLYSSDNENSIKSLQKKIEDMEYAISSAISDLEMW